MTSDLENKAEEEALHVARHEAFTQVCGLLLAEPGSAQSSCRSCPKMQNFLSSKRKELIVTD